MIAYSYLRGLEGRGFLPIFPAYSELSIILDRFGKWKVTAVRMQYRRGCGT
jgi:hypothetical protein